VRGKVNVKDESVSLLVEDVKTTLEVGRAMPEPADSQPTLQDYAWSQAVTVDETSDDDISLEEEPDKSFVPTSPTALKETPPVFTAASPPVTVSSKQNKASDLDEQIPDEPEFDDDWGFATLASKPENGHGAGKPQPLSTQSAGAQTTHTNGTSEGDNQPKRAMRRVCIEIEPLGNWQETCRQSVRLAAQYDGNDRFELQLIGPGWAMDFPNERTHFCSELARSLENLPGVRAVVLV
jgi:hypothetical protein